MSITHVNESQLIKSNPFPVLLSFLRNSMSTIISRLLERFVFTIPVPEPVLAPEPAVFFSEEREYDTQSETHDDQQFEWEVEAPVPDESLSTEAPFPDPPVITEQLDFEIDEINDPEEIIELGTPMKPAPAPTPQPPKKKVMTPSLWQAGNGEYKDTILNNIGDYIHVIYDFPKKRTDRNHLVTKGALLFVKTKIGWVLPGFVSKVVATGVYPGTEQKFAELKIKKVENTFAFANKNAALKALGFNELTDNERMHGLIPLYK
jgi:hypothetical protein